MVTQHLTGQETEPYSKLTYEEADAWLKSITYDELVAFVIEWDYIEHSIPIVIMPDLMFTLANRDLFVTSNPLDTPIIIDFNGYLKYDVVLPSYTVEDFIPKQSVWSKIGSRLGWFFAGFGTGLVLYINK